MACWKFVLKTRQSDYQPGRDILDENQVGEINTTSASDLAGLDAPGRYPVRIAGTGSSTPETIVSSTELATRLGTSVDWIRDILGVDERRLAAATETTSDFAAEASRRALANSGLTIDDIDLLIVATTTPDRLAPSTAAIVQRKLGGAKKYPAFDLAAACTGFLYGLVVGSLFVSTDTCRNVLLVGADTLTKVTDWN